MQIAKTYHWAQFLQRKEIVLWICHFPINRAEDAYSATRQIFEFFSAPFVKVTAFKS